MKFKIGQRVCEKVNNVILWGKVLERFGEKYKIKWQESRIVSVHGPKVYSFTTYKEGRDLIPEGEPDMCLKEIL